MCMKDRASIGSRRDLGINGRMVRNYWVNISRGTVVLYVIYLSFSSICKYIFSYICITYISLTINTLVYKCIYIYYYISIPRGEYVHICNIIVLIVNEIYIFSNSEQNKIYIYINIYFILYIYIQIYVYITV